MKTKAVKTENLSYEKRVKGFDKALKSLCNEYGIDLVAKLSYPQFNILPAELELCNIILNRHEGKFVIIYKDKLGGENAN